MLLFDSNSIPVRERHGAMVDSITSATAATFMTPERSGEHVHLTMHLWDLAGIEVVDARCSAHTLRRSGRQQPTSDDNVFAITCGLRGRGKHRQLDHELKVQPASLWATDFSKPYLHHVTDTWTTTAKVPRPLLGMPDRLLDPALPHLGTSPLAPLFIQHMAHVRQVADGLSVPAAASLGTATLALARALFLSVSPDGLDSDTLEDTLLMRVRAYVADHLAEAGLGPASIAAANHVSVRQLYKTCARADLQLEQWIIAQRLERAREDLARPAAAPISITALAGRWGFASPSHFTRRFRSAYGMTPREWHDLNRHQPVEASREQPGE